MNWARRGELLAANVRLGFVVQRAEWPVTVWLVARLAPELIRGIVYVLIGSIVAGEAGMRFALIGGFVLVVSGMTIGEVTDLPSIDVQTGTYRGVLLGGLPALAQYAARAVWLAGLAVTSAVVYALMVPALFGCADLTMELLARSWMLAPAVVGGLMLGLVVIAPAIGSTWEGITYNAATALVTVASGAIISPPAALGAIGQVLPFTHTVTAVRRSLDGQPFFNQLALEAAVALGWAAVAAVAYRWQEARGRRRGVGAFVA